MQSPSLSASITQRQYKIALTNVCAIFGVFLMAPALVWAGDYLPLSQTPPGSGFKGPAPNVIISVDDSSSMGAQGMDTLRKALKETFRPENVPDHSVRLAFQSFNVCDSIPSNAAGCDGKNYMQSLSGNYDPAEDSSRGRFLRWVDTLDYVGGTPMLSIMRNAGEYLKKTGANSPWNAVPGTPDNQPLACRKAYHILMSDGGWNDWGTHPVVGPKNLPDVYNNTIDNIDGTSQVLPDGKVYDPASGESRAYADKWGRQAVYGGDPGWFWQGDDGYSWYDQNTCKYYTKNCKYVYVFEWQDVVTTLSDMAFHYWATDLQPGIPNKVEPIIRVPGDETFTADGKSQTLSEYWNPKNNPATWQHMITYTIGYNLAAQWPVLQGHDPVFGTHTFDGDFPRLVVGTRKWQNPTQPPVYEYPYTTQTLPNYYLNHGYTDFYPSTFVRNGYTYTLWPEDIRAQEMWHAAINSRGKFVPAPQPSDLVNAFKDLVTSIVADSTRAVSSYASGSSTVSTIGTTAFSSFYEAKGWKGGIQAHSIAQSTAAMTASTAWGGAAASTATLLDGLSNADVANRLILTHNGTQGVSFAFTNLSADQKDLLNRARAGASATDSRGSQRVQYVRGDRSLEGSTFRTRLSRQGDIVNSALWYTAAPPAGYNLPGYTKFASKFANRTPMLYVGGNDGMLHGFSAATGVEKIAYVPRGVMRYLPDLSHMDYAHRYYVDGSPFTGDVYLNNGAALEEDRWRTMLVGSLGAGGKGYFVLDVTRPGSTAAAGGSGEASNFTVANAQTLVVMDRTEGADPDIGHITAEPVTNEYNSQISSQITRLNNGRWAVVMGNGYNSTNEQPVLLIQYLDGDQALLKISAATTGPEAVANGLSAPRLVDLTGDGTPDVAYAGDLRGNVWKFMLASSNPTQWGLAFGGKPLFTAVSSVASGGLRQPITTAPAVRVSQSAGGIMVAFGTGRNLTDADRKDTAQQSFYSVLDSTLYEVTTNASGAAELKILNSTDASAPVTGRTTLVARTFNPEAIDGKQSSAGSQFWSMGEQQALDYTQGKKGWYFDFPESGERLLRNPRFYSPGSNLIEIFSERPASGDNSGDMVERCEPVHNVGKAWRTVLGVEFGLKPNQQLLDTSGDNLYDLVVDLSTNRMTTHPKQITFRTKGERIHVSAEGVEHTGELARPFTSINWRQLQ